MSRRVMIAAGLIAHLHEVRPHLGGEGGPTAANPQEFCPDHRGLNYPKRAAILSAAALLIQSYDSASTI